MKTFPWPTIGGYDYYEVVYAFQKSIRRSLLDDALFWGSELYLSEYAAHAWGRMRVIASEDVGPAWPEACVIINTLHDNFAHDKKANSPSKDARLWFIHAIITLVFAPKSRMVDHATIVFFEGPREKRKIPDYALDVHTAQGRTMGRGYEHFFERGAILNNEADLTDKYGVRAKEIRCRKS